MLSIKKLHTFLHFAENLKTELRHGWTSTGRQESVADHCWRLSLMVVVCSKFLDKKICLEKALIMAIFHDFAECITGDTPYFLTREGTSNRQQKEIKEKIAWEKIFKDFGEIIGRDVYEIWKEYTKSETYEARFVKALDKIEALIQQNEADSSTWEECEIVDALERRISVFSDFDTFLEQLDSEVHNESEKVIKASTVRPSTCEN